MLTEKEATFLRKELTESKNPLFFYDDDPDGVCSYILMYRVNTESRGYIVKTAPNIDMKFIRRVTENSPDKLFILDIANVEQEFVDNVKLPIFCIDHHQPLELTKVHYYNPRIKNPDAYIPTTRMAYQVNNDPNDMWLAVVGCFGDWYMPDFIEEFIEKYPQLLPKNEGLFDAVYKQPIGKLVRIVSFLLKGSTSDVNQSIKVLSRIKGPEEILDQTTSQGKYLYKRFESINNYYLELIKEARSKATRSKLLLFNYNENRWSFTSDLANELTNLYPDKVILISRNKGGEMKCSLRSQKPVSHHLKNALQGIDGRGGGHPNACGTVVKEYDWERFLKNLKREIKK
jgi:hypothetical protein